MSSGTNLQEMEVDVKENAVTAGAKPAASMVKPSGASVEDLGGPTPENYKVDDDSASSEDSRRYPLSKLRMLLTKVQNLPIQHLLV